MSAMNKVVRIDPAGNRNAKEGNMTRGEDDFDEDGYITYQSLISPSLKAFTDNLKLAEPMNLLEACFSEIFNATSTGIFFKKFLRTATVAGRFQQI
jgi:hypothetical protein